MAELKRNMIELVSNPEEVAEGGEPQFTKYWTPAFVSYQKTREAVDLAAKVEKYGNDIEKIGGLVDEMEAFVIDLYGITSNDLRNGLHGPTAMQTMAEQIRFVSDGVQSEGTQAFLKEKKG